MDTKIVDAEIVTDKKPQINPRFMLPPWASFFILGIFFYFVFGIVIRVYIGLLASYIWYGAIGITALFLGYKVANQYLQQNFIVPKK